MSDIELMFAISTAEAIENLLLEFRMHDSVSSARADEQGQFILTVNCRLDVAWEIRSTVLLFDEDAEELFPNAV